MSVNTYETKIPSSSDTSSFGVGGLYGPYFRLLLSARL